MNRRNLIIHLGLVVAAPKLIFDIGKNLSRRKDSVADLFNVLNNSLEKASDSQLLVQPEYVLTYDVYIKKGQKIEEITITFHGNFDCFSQREVRRVGTEIETFNS